MKKNNLNRAKRSLNGIRLDRSLNQFSNQVLFKEKVELAEKMLATHPIPKSSH